MPGRLLPDFRPAREYPAFRRLLAGGLLSSLGSSMTSFAVVLQVWNLSRSSLAVGLPGLTFVPVLVVGLLGGSAADVMDRRKLALVASVCLMAVSAAFAAQAYAGLGLLWPLYLLATVQVVLQAASDPARRTFVPRLVPPDQLTAAIALNTLSGRITMLFGPALAGLIAAAWGLKTCYAVDTVSFVASLYATARLPAMRPRGRRPGPAPAQPARDRRGTAVHRPAAAARGRVPDRPGRHAARPAGGAVPGAERRALRRLTADPRAAQRGRRRRRPTVGRAVRPGRAGQPPGPRHAGRHDDLGRGHRRVRGDREPGGRAADARRGRGRRHAYRDVPYRDDTDRDPGRAPRPGFQRRVHHRHRRRPAGQRRIRHSRLADHAGHQRGQRRPRLPGRRRADRAGVPGFLRYQGHPAGSRG